MRDSLARLAALMAFCALSLLLAGAHSADTGLITVASKHSVPETIRRFEDAVRAKGWKFFTEIDHAAAAREVGLELKPRTVIIFGFPKGGTGPMQKAATLAIDNPPKALVWQDDQDKVWLTYNSAEYHLLTIYPRHGLPAPPAEAVASRRSVAAVGRRREDDRMLAQHRRVFRRLSEKRVGLPEDRCAGAFGADRPPCRAPGSPASSRPLRYWRSCARGAPVRSHTPSTSPWTERPLPEVVRVAILQTLSTIISF